MTTKTVTITVELTDVEAWELAQFMKRVGWTEWRNNATSNDEAYLMRDGCEKIARALRDAGYNPR
jgi:hypothetical protein